MPKTIMDVGMHVGKDTQFYLDKGFRVVAVEARPDLAAENRRKFCSYLDRGLLEIVDCAVAETEGSVPFYVFPEKDDWGTLDQGFAQRNIGRGERYEIIHVPAVRFDSILHRFGVPYYLKIDIEGADMLCIRALHRIEERPQYISCEVNVLDFEEFFAALANLHALGYGRFKIVNQVLNSRRRCPNPPLEGDYAKVSFDDTMSGPFGEEAPGAWMSAEETLSAFRRIRKTEALFSRQGPLQRYAWLYNGIARRLGGDPVGWYDLHAALGPGNSAVQNGCSK